jgi:poly-gamma-glutamate capsule biosynthesis protein CapA/YwtB (metallophosphatase superfamily)
MAKPFTLAFTGDVMLGRLIDQLFPTHVHNPSDHLSAQHFKNTYPTLLANGNYTPASPWGTTLPLLLTSDLTFINLETSVTTAPEPWPYKAFNYRMHPANLAPILQAGGVDYAGLANNHTLDFGVGGLVETVRSLRRAGVGFAGAGESVEEAQRPAALSLAGGYEVHVYAASDHPRDWRGVAGFHFLDYSSEMRARLRALLVSGARDPALKIFSVHWGPNYAWHPAEKIKSLAHFLIDECDVDIVHGHSSHHVQGVEVYRGRLIIYGCGDFVDDYALNEEYRNDLGAVWRVLVKEGGSRDASGKKGLVLDRLEVFPTRVERFRAMLLDVGDEDHDWVRRKIRSLTLDLGTAVREEVGEEGQVIIDIDQ